MPYYKPNRDKIKEDLERGTVKLWKPKSGENRIRILPPWSPEGMFYKRLYVHFRVGADNRMVVCPSKTSGYKSPCPICEYIDKNLHSGSIQEQSEASEMFARQQFLYNIVDLRDPDSGVHVYSSGVKVWNMLINFFNSEDYGDFTDPETGRDILLTKQGEGRQTTYIIIPSVKQTAIANPEWLDQLHDLDKFLSVYSYDQLKEFLYGSIINHTVEEEDEEDEEEIENKDIDWVQPECFGKYNQGSACFECEFATPCLKALQSSGKSIKV